MKKVLFLSASGAFNLGDELILAEEIRYIRTHYPDTEITVFTYNPGSSVINESYVIHFESYFPNNFLGNISGNIISCFRNIYFLLRADVVFIGGGSILFDNEPGISFRKLLWQWFFRIFWARIGRAKIVFWGIGLEVHKPKNKIKPKFLFSKKDTIYVRDRHSFEFLKVFGMNPILVHDIAFLYEPKPRGVYLSEKLRIGIALRGGFLTENTKQIQMIHKFLIDEGYEPIFLTHSLAGEIAQNDMLKIKEIMGDSSYKITQNLQETLDTYTTLYAVIGMRFHAGVLACVHEVPLIPIVYGIKGNELVKLLNLEHLALDATTLDFANFQNIWHTFITSYEVERQRMKKRKQEIQKELSLMLQI